MKDYIPDIPSVPGQPRKKEVGGLLLGVQKFSFFHSPTGECWAAEQTAGRFAVYKVGSHEFDDLLLDRYYQRFSDSPSPTALRSALGVIRARARACGDERDVALRVSRHEHTVYYDPRGPDGRIIRVTRDGWEAVANDAVAFWHPPGMLGIPGIYTQAHGDPAVVEGLLCSLFPALTEEQRMLITLWSVVGLVVGVPCPLLHFIGPPRSTSSTLAQVIKRAVDPCEGELLLRPAEGRDLFLAAKSMRFVLLADFTSLPTVLADAVHGIVTGATIRPRKLYSDDEVVITTVQRPVMLTSCEDIVQARMLRENRIRIELEQDQPAQSEAELWHDFKDWQPAILGGLLSGVAYALAHIAEVRAMQLTELSEFELWAAAAAPAFGWKVENWLRVLRQNAGEQMVDMIDVSPIGRPLVELIRRRRGYRGTASDLLATLRRSHRNIVPGNPQALSREVGRLEPALQAHGIVLTREVSKDRHRQRLMNFEIDLGEDEAVGETAETRETSVSEAGESMPDDHDTAPTDSEPEDSPPEGPGRWIVLDSQRVWVPE